MITACYAAQLRRKLDGSWDCLLSAGIPATCFNAGESAFILIGRVEHYV